MNTTFYFPHDYNAGQDYKIIALISKHSASGYGVYWRVIEMLHSDDSHSLPNNEMIWSVISMTMNTPVNDVKSIIETCIEYKLLYLTENDTIYSNRVNYNIGYRESIRQNKIDGGKKSADKRKSIQLNTSSTETEQQFNSSSTAVEQYPNKGKERKVNKGKENIDISFSSDFEETWSLYGKVGSKKSAYKVWEKLDENKKALIVASIPGYKKHLTKTGYAIKHFSTYLNSDEYENYLNISTSTGGEIKATEITIMPCLENNFDFSLARKLQGVKTREEYYQVITDNREEASKVYNCLYSFSEEEISAYKRLERRHPFNLFTELYYDYCHAQN